MNETVDKVFDHLIPETGGVAIFVENNPGNVTKKRVVKHISSDGQELTVRNATGAGPSQTKNAIRMRELRKDPAYRARENNRRRLRRMEKKEKKKMADNVDEEERVSRRIPKQSILSDYFYEVEEKTGKDTECYAIRLKDITEVATYEHVRISEMDKENVLRAVLYRTANGNIRREWESDRNFNKN